MILIDTSAWIEFLRDTGSPVCELVDELLAEEIADFDALARHTELRIYETGDHSE